MWNSLIRCASNVAEPPGAEHLEAKPVGLSVGDPGRRERADGPVLEACGEHRDVLVIDRLHLAGRLHPAMADGGTGGNRPLGDASDERASADLDDGSAQHLCGVDDVAADIGEHPAARAAAVAPRHRHLGVERVAVPGVTVEMHRPAQVALVEFATDRVDRG